MNKQMFDNNAPLQAMNSLRCVRESCIEFVHQNGCNAPKPCGKFKHLVAIKGGPTQYGLPMGFYSNMDMCVKAAERNLLTIQCV